MERWERLSGTRRVEPETASVENADDAAVATQYGRIAQRVSIPGRAFVALILWIPAFALSAVPVGWEVMLLGAMLFGTGQGLMLPTVMLWVDSLADKRRQATASSLLPTVAAGRKSTR